MTHFHYIVEDVFGKDVKIGNIKTTGIRHNKYSSALGNIIYFINKLELKVLKIIQCLLKVILKIYHQLEKEYLIFQMNQC